MKPAALTKPMPHDAAAERAVLGALIIDANVATSVFEIIGPEDFYFPHHAVLFRILAKMIANSEPVDLVSVGSHIMEIGQDTVGGPGWVAYPEDCPSPSAAATYATAIRRASQRRALLETLHAAVKVVEDAEHETPEDVGTQVAERLLGISATRRRNTWSALEAWDAVDDEALAVFEGRQSTRPTRVMPTGFPNLDEITRGGFKGGDLVIVGGAPGMGKSALAMQFCVAAIERNARAVYLSCEPRLKEWGERLQACCTCVPHERLLPRNARLRSQREWDVILAWREQHGDQLARSPFTFQPALTLEQVAMHAKRAALTGPVDIVVVDHLHLMNHGREEQLNQAIARTTAGLKELAGLLDCAVVCLSQLNRSAQSHETFRGRNRTTDGAWWDAVPLPEMSDLRDSGSIEQDADLVLFPVAAVRAGPNQSSIANAGSSAVIKVAKQRNGPKGRVSAVWDADCITYRPDLRAIPRSNHG